MATLNSEKEQEAIKIVTSERNQWQESTVWVTERVAFRMREMIRYFRKNYWGVFDQPIDTHTGREKTWAPLTQTLVEDVTKNIDINQRDMNFRAKKSEGIPITELTRNFIKDWLDSVYFGRTLDAMERNLCIDGTAVWKTWEEDGKVKRVDVDLLNLYINPTEESIYEAYRFTERSLITPSEVAQMDWENNKDIMGSNNLNPNDSAIGAADNRSTGYFVDVWEMWGKIPKWLVHSTADRTEEIDGHIIVSGLDGKEVRVHLIEENTNIDSQGVAIKPYEEVWAAKIAGRWYGLGIAERVMALQEWLNIVVNTRINRGTLAQLGLWKGKKGGGITGQMVKNLISNGIIMLNNLDDLQQVPIADVPMSAYKDEEIVWDYARKVTGAYEISTGSELPSSMPATSAAIQNKNAMSSYTMIRNSIGDFLERWIERHVLPIKAKHLKYGDIIRFSSSDQNYKQVVERVVANLANKAIEESYNSGIMPGQMEIMQAMDSAEQKMYAQPELLVKNVDKIMAECLDADFFVTNEEIDPAVVVPNLMNTLSIAPEYRDFTIKTIYDLLGLQTPTKQELPPQEGQAPSGDINAGATAPENTQQALTQALTSSGVPSPYGN